MLDAKRYNLRQRHDKIGITEVFCDRYQSIRDFGLLFVGLSPQRSYLPLLILPYAVPTR